LTRVRMPDCSSRAIEVVGTGASVNSPSAPRRPDTNGSLLIESVNATKRRHDHRVGEASKNVPGDARELLARLSANPVTLPEADEVRE
jgi:hypothetical protein